jgi:hypothetical protein
MQRGGWQGMPDTHLCCKGTASGTLLLLALPLYSMHSVMAMQQHQL